MTRVAAVDLGTNSTRLLIADIENDRLSEALKELAVELTLQRGRQRSGFSARSQRA